MKKERRRKKRRKRMQAWTSAEGVALVWISTSMHWAAYGCFDVSKPVMLLRGRTACWELRRLI